MIIQNAPTLFISRRLLFIFPLYFQRIIVPTTPMVIVISFIYKQKAYPSEVSDEEWSLAAPHLTLMTEDAPQGDYPFNRTS